MKIVLPRYMWFCGAATRVCTSTSEPVVLLLSHRMLTHLHRATALICLSNSLRCCIREVADTDIANAMFVRWYMSDRVERL